MKRILKNLQLLSLLFITSMMGPAYGQDMTRNELNQLATDAAKQSMDELYEFFSLPNDANYPEQIEGNVQWCERAFAKRGFETRRLETESVPLLLATRTHPGAQKTVLVYLQVDGQPVDVSKWDQPDPYEPVLKQQASATYWETIPWSSLEDPWDPNWRIFSRSASDARGPDMMFLKAMDIINRLRYSPNFNLKVIMDFEEELGSPQLPNAVLDHADALQADMLVIFDGPRHLTNRPTLAYGARGIATISLEVFGAKTPLHSGNYGNFVPNPAVKLSQLLSTMWNDDGRVAITGWYDGIQIPESARTVLGNVPDDEAQIMRDFGIADKENIGNNFQEAMQYPALGVLGIKSGWVGKERRTIIPASAIAEINIRLVKETAGEAMVDKVKSHIEEQGYHLIDHIPTDFERMAYSKLARFDAEVSYGAFRTELDSEIGRWLRKGMRFAFNDDPIEIRTMGGSIPISPFVNTLNIPAVIVPTVNPDNNQHSPNENIRLGNYVDGIKTITAILLQPL